MKNNATRTMLFENLFFFSLINSPVEIKKLETFEYLKTSYEYQNLNYIAVLEDGKCYKNHSNKISSKWSDKTMCFSVGGQIELQQCLNVDLQERAWIRNTEPLPWNLRHLWEISSLQAEHTFERFLQSFYGLASTDKPYWSNTKKFSN